MKESPNGVANRSHELLHRAGYIRDSVAGRYYFLPLGLRVHEKIVAIIEEEMNKTGAQRIVTPTLHQLELWKETNRTNTTGFELMVVKDRRGSDFALGGTAEEMLVDLVRKFTVSYRDLPFNLYQFSTKFRDEMRARGGLLRVREFIMKDAYSFHTTEEDFKREYEVMAQTYTTIFKRLGLTSERVEADNGYIGGEYCHEYIVESPVGESRYLATEDGSYVAHEDVAQFDRGEMNPDEKVKKMEVIDQPEWVQTMEDNEKHYKEPQWRFLKNVVYRNTVSGEIIIVCIRGDLEVNKTKVEAKLQMVGQLEAATDEDLATLGTKSGYVHSWGHTARYVGDISLTSVNNFIGGQKEETTDTINVNYGRDFSYDVLDDFALAQDGFVAKNGSKLREKKGVEVGNIFQLGYHYSKLMNATYKGQDGTDHHYYMGCYGIGVGRTMATIAEVYSDEKGLVWPKEVAPYHVHLIGIFGGNEDVRTEADRVYQELIDHGVEVLYDDRDLRAGEKFADAELIGIPLRIVVSEKTMAQGGVEVTERVSGNTTFVAESALLEQLMQ